MRYLVYRNKKLMDFLIVSCGLFSAGVAFADPAPSNQQIQQQLNQVVGDINALSQQINQIDREIAQLNNELRDIEERVSVTNEDGSVTVDTSSPEAKGYWDKVDNKNKLKDEKKKKEDERKKKDEEREKLAKQLQSTCTYTPPGTGTGTGEGGARCKEGEIKSLLAGTVITPKSQKGFIKITIIPRGVRGLSEGDRDAVLGSIQNGIILTEWLDGLSGVSINEGFAGLVGSVVQSAPGYANGVYGSATGNATGLSDAFIGLLSDWNNNNHLSGAPGVFKVIIDTWTASWKIKVTTTPQMVCRSGAWVSSSSVVSREVLEKVCVSSQDSSPMDFSPGGAYESQLDNIVNGSGNGGKKMDPWGVAGKMAMQSAIQKTQGMVYGMCEAFLASQ